LSKRKRRAGKRRPATERPSPAPSQPRSRSGRGEPEERPAPPWGSFPLSELLILVGAVLLVIGFLSGEGPRQATLLATGLVVASLGALEVSVREHLAGYRSHTILLAAVPAVVLLALLFFLGPESLPPIARLAIAAVVFGLAAWGLTAVFQARSGRAFRVKAPRR